MNYCPSLACGITTADQYHKTDINKITEIVARDNMNTYGIILIIANFRNISAVSLTFGKGIPGTSTSRNSHKGSQPSFTL